jgi:hypothetical protein
MLEISTRDFLKPESQTMVDSINNAALRLLIGAQNASPNNSLSALKNNPRAQKAVTAFFGSNNETAASTNAPPKRTSANALTTDTPFLLADTAASGAALPSNLPRGSLLDVLV